MILSGNDKHKVHMTMLATARAYAKRSLRAASVELLKRGVNHISEQEFYNEAVEQTKRLADKGCKETTMLAKGTLLLAIKDNQESNLPDESAYQAYADTYTFLVYATIYEAIKQAFNISDNINTLLESFNPENPTIN